MESKIFLLIVATMKKKRLDVSNLNKWRLGPTIYTPSLLEEKHSWSAKEYFGERIKEKKKIDDKPRLSKNNLTPPWFDSLKIEQRDRKQFDYNSFIWWIMTNDWTSPMDRLHRTTSEEKTNYAHNAISFIFIISIFAYFYYREYNTNIYRKYVWFLFNGFDVRDFLLRRCANF